MPSEKHLDLISAVITRLAGNSFQMKSWNVALATAAIGFAASKDSHPAAAALAAIPAAAFWFLDAYYLALERLYRDLFTRANAGTVAPYTLQVNDLGFGDWWTALWRPSVAGLHIAMIFAIVVVALVPLHA